MIRSFFHSFQLAFDNLRANLFHTFFSVLGIVIGVAALVATLSMIDGLEKTIKEQITATTTLKAVGISPKQFKKVNGLSVKTDSLQVLDYGRFQRLLQAVGPHERTMLSTSATHEIAFAGKKEPVAARLEFSSTAPRLCTLAQTFPKANLTRANPLP
jgi:putative ABC transport system permease protein